MKIKIFSRNNASVNSYVLVKNDKALCIDPGFNGSDIYHFFIENNLVLTKVVLTHAHFDHIRDIEFLAQYFDFELYLHSRDVEILTNNKYNYAYAFNSEFKLPQNISTVLIHDGDEITFMDEKLKIISTPGHTAGSICVKYQNYFFSGDTLFYDSIGRTDLYSGNNAAIHASLRKILSKISNGANIYPGHGKTGKLKDIKLANSYLKNLDY